MAGLGSIADRYRFFRSPITTGPRDLYRQARFDDPFDDSTPNLEREGSTTCGTVEFTPTYNMLKPGRPNLASKRMYFYYQTLCDFCTSIPLSNQWIVFINPYNRPNVVNKIKNLRTQYERTRQETDWKIDVGVDGVWNERAQDVIGCIFSHGVTIPGENIQINKAGVTSGRNQGFVKSSTIGGRQDFEPINVVFKETTCSFVDFFLRPWSIISSYEGLHATTDEDSIKGEIAAFFLADTTPFEDPVIRKAFYFYDAVPISVNAEDYTFESSQLIQRQVQFTYNYYSAWDGYEISSRFGSLEALGLRDTIGDLF